MMKPEGRERLRPKLRRVRGRHSSSSSVTLSQPATRRQEGGGRSHARRQGEVKEGTLPPAMMNRSRVWELTAHLCCNTYLYL